MSNGTPWMSVQPIPHNSVVGGGALLLDAEGKSVGQVMVIGAAQPRQTEEAVCRQLVAFGDTLKALEALTGYLLNAKIDLETGTPKRTTIGTLEGGLRVARAAITRATGQES
ncbi:MAG: hypothetical protein A49_03710 [Methyloceanibacter sp.]|nr:MAG: hypothetical protein A49_03710 [Methyloceanibacter sp.]